jgi:outer membrane protein assembly factor BamB
MLVSYDPATGEERWRNEDIAGAPLSHPVLDETTAYLGYGSLYAAFDLATGRVRWRTPRGDFDPPSPLQGKPVISLDRIFLAGRDGSYAVTK